MIDGLILLDWGDVAIGPGMNTVGYEVEQRRPKKFWKFFPWPDEREILSPGSSLKITDSSAVIGNLVDGKVYYHRVRTVVGDRRSDWSDEIKTEMPFIPHLGHQADHTVQYRFGLLPQRAPDGKGPAAIIRAAVYTAANTWNEAVASTWPNLLFCQDCAGKNRDGYSITIDVINGEDGPNRGSEISLDIRAVLETLPFGVSGDCGRKTACVKPRSLLDVFSFFGPGAHMKNLTMTIEEPAWSYDGSTHTRRIWTNNRAQHKDKTMEGHEIFYLPVVIMHEFGHAAGLDDLNHDAYPGYMMSVVDDDLEAIPQKDIASIHRVYRNEHGTMPH